MQNASLIYVNNALASLGGYTVEEVLNWGQEEFLKTIFPEFRKTMIDNMEQTLLNDKIDYTDFNLKCMKKNGDVFWVKMIWKKIQYKEKPAILGLVIDITERIVYEEKLKDSEKKFRKAYNRVEFYKDIFTHDINNILQSILSSNQLLSMLPPSEEENENFGVFLDIISSEVNRGKNLVKSIKKLNANFTFLFIPVLSLTAFLMLFNQRMDSFIMYVIIF